MLSARPRSHTGQQYGVSFAGGGDSGRQLAGVRRDWNREQIPLPPLPPDRCALSAVEGWRGEILHWIRTGAGNRLERCKIKDPSLNNWPGLVEAVQGNIVPDFPVINKSFNLSYSGTDR